MRHSVIVVLIAFSLCASNSAFKIDPLIVNGQKAERGQFPYYAFLRSFSKGEVNQLCGASLISDEWVITAAHCIDSSEPGSKITQAELTLGTTKFLEPEPGAKSILVQSDGLFIHPKWDANQAMNDVALIHLPEKVQLSKYIQPVKLPMSGGAPANADAVAIGSGYTGDDDWLPAGILSYAFLSTVPLDVCLKTYPILEGHKDVLCVNSTNNDAQAICNGDSGGALVRLSDSTLIGITSFSEGCESGLPQVFSNVFYHLNWIQDVTGLDWGMTGCVDCE